MPLRTGKYFLTPRAASIGWAAGGLTYASYNVVGAVIILPVLRHLRSNRDALVAGVLAGPMRSGPVPAVTRLAEDQMVVSVGP